MADILALQELDTESGPVTEPGMGSSESGVCSAASYVGCA